MEDSTIAESKEDLQQHSSPSLSFMLTTSNMPVVEAPVCRVCHGESEPDRELFYPCKCDGSIKYVHQNCLEEWLKHSREKTRCELCKEPFHFKKIYKNDVPVQLTILEMFGELIPRLLAIGRLFVNVALSCFSWGICLPMFACLLLKLCWCSVSESDIGQCYRKSLTMKLTVESIVNTWYSGIVNICMVALITFFAAEVGRVIFKEVLAIENNHRIAVLERQVNITNEAVRELQESNCVVVSEILPLLHKLCALEMAIRRAQRTITSRQFEEIRQWEMFNEEISSAMYMWQKERVRLISLDAYQLRVDRVRGTIAGQSSLLHVIKHDMLFLERIMRSIEASLLTSRLSLGAVLLRYAQSSLHLLGKQFQAAHFMAQRNQNYTHQNSQSQFSPADTARFVVFLNQEVVNIRQSSQRYREQADSSLQLLLDEIQQAAPYTMTENLLSSASAEALETSTEIVVAPVHHDRVVIEENNQEATSVSVQDDSNQVVEVANLLAAHDVKGLLDQLPEQGPQHQKPEEEVLEVPEEVVIEEDQDDTRATVSSVLDEIVEYLSDPDLHDDEHEAAEEEEEEVLPMTPQHQLYQRIPPPPPPPAPRAADNEIEIEFGAQVREIFQRHFEGHQPQVLPLPAPPAVAPVAVQAGLPLVPQQQQVQHALVAPLQQVAVAPAPQPPAPQAPAQAQQAQNNINNNDNGPFDLNYYHLLGLLAYLLVFAAATVVIPALLGKVIRHYLLGASETWNVLKEAIENVILKENNAAMLIKLFDFEEDTVGNHSNMTGDEGDMLMVMITSVEAIDKTKISDFLLSKIKALVDICLGYGCVLWLVIIGYLLYCCKYLAFLTHHIYATNATHRNSWLQTVKECTHALILAGYRAVNMSSKASLILLLYAGLLPVIFALIMLKSVKQVLSDYIHMPNDNGDIESDDSGPMIALFVLLYILSFGIAAHIAFVFSELRPLLNLQALARHGLPIDLFTWEPVLDHLTRLHTQIGRLTHVTILKTFALEACLLIPGVLATVVLPLKIGHLLSGSSQPLRIRLESVMVDLQMPVELVVSHILVPLLADRLQYYKVVKWMLKWSVQYCVRVSGLDMEDVLNMEAFGGHQAQPMHHHAQQQQQHAALLPPPPLQPQLAALAVAMEEERQEAEDDQAQREEEESVDEFEEDAHEDDDDSATVAEMNANRDTINQQALVLPPPTSQPLRLALFLFLLLLAITLLSSWAIHLPLQLGRLLFSFTIIHCNNDLLNFPAGMAVAWAIGHTGQYLLNDVLRADNTMHLLRVVAKWSLVLAKVVLAGVLWLSTLPMLLGYCLEALLVMPFRFEVSKTALFPMMQAWALGLILLKLYIKCVLAGVFGDTPLRDELEMVLIRGFAHFDLKLFISRIFLPLLMPLCDVVFVSFFTARALGVALDASYEWRTIFVRFSLHTYLLLKVMIIVSVTAVKYLINLHNEIRDSRYLIGTELTNLNRPNRSGATAAPLQIKA